MSELVERLRVALDEAEREARIFTSDIPPAFLLRLIERDRRLIADYENAVAAFEDPMTQLHPGILLPRNTRRLELQEQVERAADFWLGDNHG